MPRTTRPGPVLVGDDDDWIRRLLGDVLAEEPDVRVVAGREAALAAVSGLAGAARAGRARRPVPGRRAVAAAACPV